jgi:hypothetical protein
MCQTYKPLASRSLCPLCLPDIHNNCSRSTVNDPYSAVFDTNRTVSTSARRDGHGSPSYRVHTAHVFIFELVFNKIRYAAEDCLIRDLTGKPRLVSLSVRVGRRDALYILVIPQSYRNRRLRTHSFLVICCVPYHLIGILPTTEIIYARFSIFRWRTLLTSPDTSTVVVSSRQEDLGRSTKASGWNQITHPRTDNTRYQKSQ